MKVLRGEGAVKVEKVRIGFGEGEEGAFEGFNDLCKHNVSKSFSEVH